MKMTRWKKSLSLLLCMVLIAATALVTTSCGDNRKPGQTPASSTTPETSEPQITVLGEGGTQFYLTVRDKEGRETRFDVRTDKTTVGDALLELGLIAGEKSVYGLFVKTVNGITVDYDTDGSYWAFYVNGKYASAGIDATEITVGATYSLQVES